MSEGEKVFYVVRDNLILGTCREEDFQKVREYFFNKYGWDVEFFKDKREWMKESFEYQEEIDKLRGDKNE
jgi:hypothetical protein